MAINYPDRVLRTRVLRHDRIDHQTESMRMTHSTTIRKIPFQIEQEMHRKSVPHRYKELRNDRIR